MVLSIFVTQGKMLAIKIVWSRDPFMRSRKCPLVSSYIVKQTNGAFLKITLCTAWWKTDFTCALAVGGRMAFACARNSEAWLPALRAANASMFADCPLGKLYCKLDPGSSVLSGPVQLFETFPLFSRRRQGACHRTRAA